MPTYEYECQQCGRQFEVQQGIMEPSLGECPECGGELRRLVSGGTGFILKGGSPGRARKRDQACSLDQGGGTCCGRESRCERPPCGEA